MIILPDAPRIINIGTQVSLCGGTALGECTSFRNSGSTREHVPVIAVTISEHVPIPEVAGRERDHTACAGGPVMYRGSWPPS